MHILAVVIAVEELQDVMAWHHCDSPSPSERPPTGYRSPTSVYPTMIQIPVLTELRKAGGENCTLSTWELQFGRLDRPLRSFCRLPSRSALAISWFSVLLLEIDWQVRRPVSIVLFWRLPFVGVSHFRQRSLLTECKWIYMKIPSYRAARYCYIPIETFVKR
jgi:hypothetical protein